MIRRDANWLADQEAMVEVLQPCDTLAYVLDPVLLPDDELATTVDNLHRWSGARTTNSIIRALRDAGIRVTNAQITRVIEDHCLGMNGSKS